MSNEKKIITVGKATKIALAVVAFIILANLCYFAFHWNLLAGIAITVLTVVCIPLAWAWIKSDKPNGRWW